MFSPVFLHDFEDAEDVFREFSVHKDDQVGIHILLASYSVDGYDGSAFVLFRKEGKMFEVHGSHCSCYGLDDQWAPSEVTVAELKAQFARYTPSYYGDELLSILPALEAMEDPKAALAALSSQEELIDGALF